MTVSIGLAAGLSLMAGAPVQESERSWLRVGLYVDFEEAIDLYAIPPEASEHRIMLLKGISNTAEVSLQNDSDSEIAIAAPEGNWFSGVSLKFTPEAGGASAVATPGSGLSPLYPARVDDLHIVLGPRQRLAHALVIEGSFLDALAEGKYDLQVKFAPPSADGGTPRPIGGTLKTVSVGSPSTPRRRASGHIRSMTLSLAQFRYDDALEFAARVGEEDALLSTMALQFRSNALEERGTAEDFREARDIYINVLRDKAAEARAANGWPPPQLTPEDIMRDYDWAIADRERSDTRLDETRRKIRDLLDEAERLQSLDDLKGAMKSVRRALSLNQGSFNTHIFAAEILSRMGKFRLAQQHLIKARKEIEDRPELSSQPVAETLVDPLLAVIETRIAGLKGNDEEEDDE